jgi:ubiquitin-like domain-containing CTD phosphatase 1
VFDHRTKTVDVASVTRPHLHEFLAAAYAHYDICFWSATSMKWIDAKLDGLGIYSHPHYLVSLVRASILLTHSSASYSRGCIACTFFSAGVSGER